MEVDGTNIGGHYRKAKEKKRGAEQPSGLPSARRALLALRERAPDGVTRPAVFTNEAAYRDAKTGRDFIRDNVIFGTNMVSDEGFELGYIGQHDRVKHKEAFQIEGIHNNGIESYFARLKRAKRGVYYGFGSPDAKAEREDYTILYAEEIAWREDHRRKSNGEQFRMMVAAVAGAPRSRRMAGYWTRSRMRDEGGVAVPRRKPPGPHSRRGIKGSPEAT